MFTGWEVPLCGGGVTLSDLSLVSRQLKLRAEVVSRDAQVRGARAVVGHGNRCRRRTYSERVGGAENRSFEYGQMADTGSPDFASVRIDRDAQ